jgi:hypothetical protein
VAKRIVKTDNRTEKAQRRRSAAGQDQTDIGNKIKEKS